MPPVPRVQIVAGLLRRGDNVLLVQQLFADTGKRFWNLPGGGVEDGELLHEAAAREIQEETGLLVSTPSRLLWITHHDTPEYPSALACVFEFDQWKGDLSINDPDGLVLDTRFFLPTRPSHGSGSWPSRSTFSRLSPTVVVTWPQGLYGSTGPCLPDDQLKGRSPLSGRDRV